MEGAAGKLSWTGGAAQPGGKEAQRRGSPYVVAVEASPEMGRVPVQEVVAPELVLADVLDVGPGIGNPGDRHPEIPERTERPFVIPDGERPADPPFIVVPGLDRTGFGGGSNP